MEVTSRQIRLVLADVDGTLVTGDKRLTDATIAAVASLRRAGIELAVTSGRPPRGMSMLIAPLELTTPIAAFNGGALVRPDLSIIEQREVPALVVGPIASLMSECGLDVWMYSGSDWYVLDGRGPHVDREAGTVGFAPTVVDSYDDITNSVVKMVGVSDDLDAVKTTESTMREKFGEEVSAARSQPYYLDVTHPKANKGSVITYLSGQLDIPLEAIASIGDMPNDVLMFAHSGVSIAMGNASHEVQRSARYVTSSNEEEGFARAMERFVLRH
ncbi:MAG: Cof-type HAD-IIB family hydrolase [Acidimicrobiia bacterium]